MNTKRIIYSILTMVLSITITTSCGEWEDLPPGASFDKNGISTPTPVPTPDPDPEPEPDPKPTERGTLYETGVVDLGLSVNWSACNLGAEYCWYGGDKYNFGNLDNNCPEEIGGTEDDHATQILGNEWSTPSLKQWEELRDNCLVETGHYRNVQGIFVTGTTQKTIFIPYYHSYWTSTISLESNEGYYFILYNNLYNIFFDRRTQGRQYTTSSFLLYIRPVKKK